MNNNEPLTVVVKRLLPTTVLVKLSTCGSSISWTQKFTYVVEMAKVMYVSNPICNVQLHIFRELAILELSVLLTENSLRSCQRITAKAINDANILWGQSGFET